MRTLFTCVVGHGHFQPMAPLATAFRAAGHEVVVAMDPANCPAIRELGFDAVPAGLDHADALSRFNASVPDWAAAPLEDRMRIQPAADDRGSRPSVVTGFESMPSPSDVVPLLVEFAEQGHVEPAGTSPLRRTIVI